LVAYSESSLIPLSLQAIMMVWPRFSIHAQNGNLSTLFQFDATSLPLHNPLVNTSQQIQVPGTDNLLALDPPWSFTTGSHGFGESNLNS